MEGNVAIKYISDIPWDKYPSLAFTDDAESYLKAFRKVFEVIPSDEDRVSFLNDVWDFSGYIESINPNVLKFDFNRIPSHHRIYVKFFVLYMLMNRLKIESVRLRYESVVILLTDCLSSFNVDYLEPLTYEQAVSYIEHRCPGYSGRRSNVVAWCQYYEFLTLNFNMKGFSMNLKKLEAYRKAISRKAHIMADENRSPDIPQEYFDDIKNAALKAMNNPDEDYNMRCFAAIFLIDIETGFRPSDLLTLRKDALMEIDTTYGIRVYMIDYSSKKPGKAGASEPKFLAYTTPAGGEAFKTLLEIRQSHHNADKSEYLFILENKKKNDENDDSGKYPVQIARFRYYYKKFFTEYLHDDILKEWNGISQTTIIDRSVKNSLKRVVNIPALVQFRVHYCTRLYRLGIPLGVIREYMGHLSEAMEGYYARPPQEELLDNQQSVSRFVVETLINGTKLLGGNNDGDYVVDSIKKMLAEKGITVYNDVEEVAKSVDSMVRIRSKKFGLCIKSNKIAGHCPDDIATNNFLCSFGYCQNLFYMYWMAPESYADLKNIISASIVDADRGFVKEAQREYNKAVSLLERRLRPEIEALKEEISKHGKAKILLWHPELNEFMNNLNKIQSQIKLWMKKNPALGQ